MLMQLSQEKEKALNVTEIIDDAAIVRLSNDDIKELRYEIEMLLSDSEFNNQSKIIELAGRLVGLPIDDEWVEYDEWSEFV